MDTGKRPPLDEQKSLWQATIAAEGVTTSAGEGTGLSLIDAGLAGAGDNSFVSMLAIIHPGEASVDSKDITAFNDGTGAVTVATAFKDGQVAAGVAYKIVTFRFVPAEVATIASILGALNTAAATGAVSNAKEVMAYIKQLITGLALDGSAPLSYDYTKATVPGWLHGFHMIRRILFVIPEAIDSITVHNTAIKDELDKLGLVITITQADALTYPDYESITLTVLGSPLAGSAWNTANLAHIKSVFGLPVICVDAAAAVYLKMGTDGGDALTKTVLNAVANIEGSILGAGIDDTVGLAAGANPVADAGVTFSTLDMSNANITKIWYAYESVNAHTDVILGEIRKTMPDGTSGKDLDGADVPGTLAFYGCAYSMNGLNTLGKATFHLLVEKLLHSSTAGLAVILSGEVGNIAATLGVRATPAAAGPVTTTDKAMAYIKQLVTELIVVDGLVGTIDAATTDSLHGKIGTDTEMADHSLYDLLGGLAFKTHALSAMLGALTATDNLVDILGGYTAAASLKDALDAIAGYLDTEIAAIEGKLDLPAANETANTKIGEVVGQKGDAANVTASQASVIGLLRAVITTYLADGTIGLSNLQTLLAAITAAGPTNAQMETARDAIITEVDANETKIDTIDGIVDTLLTRVTAAVALASALTTHDTDIKTLLNTIAGYLDTEIAAILADTGTDGVVVNSRTAAFEKLVGVKQIAVETIDIQLAAASYILFTGTEQDVLIDSLVFRCARDCSGDPTFTGISIETDNATEQVFIPQGDGVKANLTEESQLSWTGAILLKATQTISLTIYGGATAAPSVCEVIVNCRAVVSGGYLTPTYGG